MLHEDQKSLFMTWLGEHGSSVMKVARAYTLTNEECQDLTQEILLQAWRSLPKFEGKANVATWFYRVALLTAMNWHRKDRPRRSKQQPLLEVQAVVADGLDSGEQAQQRETVRCTMTRFISCRKRTRCWCCCRLISGGGRMPRSSSQAAGRLASWRHRHRVAQAQRKPPVRKPSRPSASRGSPEALWRIPVRYSKPRRHPGQPLPVPLAASIPQCISTATTPMPSLAL